MNTTIQTEKTFWFNELEKIGFTLKECNDGTLKAYFRLEWPKGESKGWEWEPQRRNQYYWTKICVEPVKDVWKVTYSRSYLFRTHTDVQVYETGEQMHSEILCQKDKKTCLWDTFDL